MNKNRKIKEFSVNNIVFTIDKQVVPGNTHPLKTKFHPSPYVVLKPYYTTCLIQRLSDGFRALYSVVHIKKYKGGDPLFQDLPPLIKEVLLNKFEDLLNDDFCTIIKLDPLEIPDGVSLLSEDEEKMQTSKPPVFCKGHADMSLDPNIKELITEVGTSQGAVSEDDNDDDDDSDDEDDKMVLRSGKRVSFL